MPASGKTAPNGLVYLTNGSGELTLSNYLASASGSSSLLASVYCYVTVYLHRLCCCLEGHADLPPLRAREADGAAGARLVSASKDDLDHRGRQLVSASGANSKGIRRRGYEPARAARCYTREAIGDMGTTARASSSRATLYTRGYRRRGDDSSSRMETRGRQLEPREAIRDGDYSTSRQHAGASHVPNQRVRKPREAPQWGGP